MNTLYIVLFFIIIAGLILLMFTKGKSHQEERNLILNTLNALDINHNLKNTSNRDIILKLDTLLSKTLQIYFNNKKTCGENLKLAKSVFHRDEYNKLWEVHKMRNSVVHDLKEISDTELQSSYKTYRIAINKLIK